MFKLIDTEGRPALMKNGEPFIYTSKETARTGKRVLEADRKVILRITTA